MGAMESDKAGWRPDEEGSDFVRVVGEEAESGIEIEVDRRRAELAVATSPLGSTPGGESDRSLARSGEDNARKKERSALSSSIMGETGPLSVRRALSRSSLFGLNLRSNKVSTILLDPIRRHTDSPMARKSAQQFLLLLPQPRLHLDLSHPRHLCLVRASAIILKPAQPTRLGGVQRRARGTRCERAVGW